MSTIPVGVGVEGDFRSSFLLFSKQSPLYSAKYVTDIKRYLLNKCVSK